jgi:hypothetical protein
MTEFLQSIRADLFSRRLLPFVALVGVALIAAVAYAVTGGSSSPAPVSSTAAPSPTAPGGAAGLPVAVAPASPNQAVSETPAGVRYQSQSPTRDPFVPLPSPPAAKSASTSGSASSSGKSSAAGSSSGSKGSTGAGAPGGKEAPVPAPAKPTKPSKPRVAYDVSVLFGRASTTPGQIATPVPYENLKLLQPLPSKQDVRVSFERVTINGKGAVFKFVVPPILRGSGICLPSTSECQTIDLEAGHAEELEYIEANGQAIVYELKVVSIVKKSGGASAARVKRNASDVHAPAAPRG